PPMERAARVIETFWSGKPVIVTGGSGFIGSHLVRRLVAAGADVHLLARSVETPTRLSDLPIRLHRWSLQDQGDVATLLRSLDAAVLFHGAVHRNPGTDGVEPQGADGERAAFAVTTEGGKRLMEAAAAAEISRVVFLSSSSEYGAHPVPLTEDLADAPVSIHGRSKAALTHRLIELARDTGFPVVILRIFYAYGTGDDPRRFIPIVCRAAIDRGGIRLTPRGAVRDYVHVDDVVEACMRAGSLPLQPGEIINVGSGVQTDNQDLVALVQELAGGFPSIAAADFPPRASDTGHWVADTSRLRARLGMSDLVDLRTGLTRLLDVMDCETRA
ncbi:MAG TPA: NAD-dependent epimerase/dehydratase family protein, partial [Sphingomonas sp.]|nr:NAD-dependent epimerase/dehydratase family protein [Sphingomonas sp.]